MNKNAKLKKRAVVLVALRKKSEPASAELIRRRLAQPVEKRMSAQRIGIPGGGSHLSALSKAQRRRTTAPSPRNGLNLSGLCCLL